MLERTNASGRLGGDGGAVVVEAAIVLPLLLLLVSGLIDFGGAFREETVIQAATRNAARAGATASGVKTVPAGSPAGTLPMAVWADMLALSSLDAGLSGRSASLSIDKVIIYRANGQPQGKPTTGCINTIPTGSGSGVPGSCNVYNYTQMNTAAAQPVTRWAGQGCAANLWDSRWCPYGRVVNLTSATMDQLGVYVHAWYEPFTGIFSDQPIEITDYAVMAVEPNPRN